MSKVIVIKLTKAPAHSGPFDIIGNGSIIIDTGVTRAELIAGKSYTVDDDIEVITIRSTGDCGTENTFPILTTTTVDLAHTEFDESRTSCVWRHLTDARLYNDFYGVTEPYVIEYPFAYQYNDEILQNVQDYTKVYKYLEEEDFNNNARIELDDAYFNKAVLYNGQQSTGILELNPKPKNNLKLYNSYPIYNSGSKSILYTKSDNFYQYNTFWSIVKDKTVPLFTRTCESMSIDKIVNQDNMRYDIASFKKETLRAKELKVRHILDDRNDINLVSQFVIAPAQISYK